MFEEYEGHDFYRTKEGELLPRFATPQTIKMARGINANSNEAVMQGSFRLKGWENGIFRFKVNRSSAIYKDNGAGNYELQLGMPAPSNKGNGF